VRVYGFRFRLCFAGSEIEVVASGMKRVGLKVNSVSIAFVDGEILVVGGCCTGYRENYERDAEEETHICF
jgi:DNA/RNA endonuclease YhcR with UshA esterase domain